MGGSVSKKTKTEEAESGKKEVAKGVPRPTTTEVQEKNDKTAGAGAGAATASGVAAAGEEGVGGKEESGAEVHNLNMLLLGGPNVGKSTIFRQMRLLYMGGFTQDQRILARLQITENILDSVVKVCHLCYRKFGTSFDPDNMEIAEDLEALFDDFASRDPKDTSYSPLTDEQWENIESLMADEEYVKAYTYMIDPKLEKKSDEFENFFLVDHAIYFIERLKDIQKDDYVPTDAEILMLRRVTEGRESIEFDVDVDLPNGNRQKFHLQVTDVGGQAQEQEEWKAVCEESPIDSVIYVCALSEFDSIDSNGKNVLKSQLSLLSKIVKSSLFQDTDLVVMMNKTDLLAKKLQHKQIQDYFKAFREIPNDPEEVIQHFHQELENLSRKVLEKRGVSEVGRLPFVIPTCALDTEMVEKIIPKLCENLMMKTLNEIGFI